MTILPIPTTQRGVLASAITCSDRSGVDTWQMIKAERIATADALAALPPADWDRPSLCAEWTVRDVVAHMIDSETVTPPKFFARFAASGFRFPVMTRRNIEAIREGRSDRELLELLRSRTDARTAPPGPVLSWLGEAIVHGEDATHAVGGYRDHPIEHLVAVADFYKRSNALIGTKRRIDGLSLRATDTDWRHGEGPEVSGPMIALVMAMTGRRAALSDLSGDGVAVLHGRS
jgi:uncharacterized protein (TIGR03083 family)